jgi:hypothetical protein
MAHRAQQVLEASQVAAGYAPQQRPDIASMTRDRLPHQPASARCEAKAYRPAVVGDGTALDEPDARQTLDDSGHVPRGDEQLAGQLSGGHPLLPQRELNEDVELGEREVFGDTTADLA